MLLPAAPGSHPPFADAPSADAGTSMTLGPGRAEGCSTDEGVPVVARFISHKFLLQAFITASPPDQPQELGGELPRERERALKLREQPPLSSQADGVSGGKVSPARERRQQRSRELKKCVACAREKTATVSCAAETTRRRPLSRHLQRVHFSESCTPPPTLLGGRLPVLGDLCLIRVVFCTYGSIQ